MREPRPFKKKKKSKLQMSTTRFEESSNKDNESFDDFYANLNFIVISPLR